MAVQQEDYHETCELIEKQVVQISENIASLMNKIENQDPLVTMDSFVPLVTVNPNEDAVNESSASEEESDSESSTSKQSVNGPSSIELDLSKE